MNVQIHTKDETWKDLQTILAKLTAAQLAIIGLAVKADPALTLTMIDNHIKIEMGLSPEAGRRKNQ